MRNNRHCDIRIICDKADATDVGSAVIEGMKREGYKLLKCSKPFPSRKNDSDVLVYLELIQES